MLLIYTCAFYFQAMKYIKMAGKQLSVKLNTSGTPPRCAVKNALSLPPMRVLQHSILQSY